MHEISLQPKSRTWSENLSNNTKSLKIEQYVKLALISTDTVTPAETYLAPVPETTEWTWLSLRHSAKCVVSGSGAGGRNKHTMQQVSVIVKHLYSNEYFFKHCKKAKAQKWMILLCMNVCVDFCNDKYFCYLHYYLISKKIKHSEIMLLSCTLKILYNSKNDMCK